MEYKSYNKIDNYRNQRDKVYKIKSLKGKIKSLKGKIKRVIDKESIG